ncbi:MAG: hypothetical protein DHS20C08_11400 [Rhodomicrobium sp.]|nr:MAG: hypothetical protein DHS20C08_11400 [Rhodomicrobium sp.]
MKNKEPQGLNQHEEALLTDKVDLHLDLQEGDHSDYELGEIYLESTRQVSHRETE